MSFDSAFTDVKHFWNTKEYDESFVIKKKNSFDQYYSFIETKFVYWFILTEFNDLLNKYFVLGIKEEQLAGTSLCSRRS